MPAFRCKRPPGGGVRKPALHGVPSQNGVTTIAAQEAAAQTMRATGNPMARIPIDRRFPTVEEGGRPPDTTMDA